MIREMYQLTLKANPSTNTRCAPFPPLSMPPAQLVGADDLQEIFADAFTSFSPLGVLVGAKATCALSNEVSNKKQLVAASLAPIGALRILSTLCKGGSQIRSLLPLGKLI